MPLCQALTETRCDVIEKKIISWGDSVFGLADPWRWSAEIWRNAVNSQR